MIVLVGVGLLLAAYGLLLYEGIWLSTVDFFGKSGW